MIRFAGTAAVLAIMAATLPAHARDAVQLTPNSDWVLDYADERCSLFRTFGTGRDELHLQIDSYGTYYNYYVTLAGNGVPRSQGANGTLSYRLTPDHQMRRDLPALLGQAGNRRTISITLDFGPHLSAEAWEGLDYAQLAELRNSREGVIAAFARQVDNMEVVLGRSNVVDLQLGAMGPPLDALHQCIDDLYRHWGVDPDIQNALARKPIPLPGTVEKIIRNYPRSMVGGGMSAVVPVRLMVAADGSTSQCVVQASNVEPQFEQAVCDGLADGFEPAIDQSGNAVTALFQTSVVYIVQ